jgi:hypothetical protein
MVGKTLGVQKGYRRIIQKCMSSQELMARLFASRKMNLSEQRRAPLGAGLVFSMPANKGKGSE